MQLRDDPLHPAQCRFAESWCAIKSAELQWPLRTPPRHRHQYHCRLPSELPPHYFHSYLVDQQLSFPESLSWISISLVQDRCRSLTRADHQHMSATPLQLHDQPVAPCSSRPAFQIPNLLRHLQVHGQYFPTHSEAWCAEVWASLQTRVQHLSTTNLRIPSRAPTCRSRSPSPTCQPLH